MPRHLLLNTASWHLLLLSSILPHSTSPSSFLALSYFCGGFTWITHPYLTDSLGQNDFHLDNSGRQNHRIAPRRAPKCPRRYFSVSLHCSTHCYSSKSLPISDFCDSWSNTLKKTDLSNAVVVLTSPHGKEDHSVSWHTKGMQNASKTPVGIEETMSWSQTDRNVPAGFWYLSERGIWNSLMPTGLLTLILQGLGTFSIYFNWYKVSLS